MDDIDLIKQKINIVDLIQEYFPLKKAGVNFKAPCPFHQEKTPSFIVSPERGIWHCFGCGKGGDIFKFLMEKEGFDFPEALETLAKKAGIPLKRQKSQVREKKDRLYEANLKAGQFFHFLLTEHKLGKKALEYLKKRGVEEKTMKEFNLGYAPNSWESLTRFLKKRGFSAAELTEAGLLIPSQKGGYDRFRGRIIFPLANVQEQVAGFAGRTLDLGEPKYLNTPVTPVFDKSHFLFGLNLAKNEIRSKNFVILVEGLMDMIMSYQAGVKNVVAVQGTALTAEQIDLLKKYTDTVYICFDQDLAGDMAARRGIELADQAGFNLKVIQIKDGKDPAEIVAKDVKLWLEAVEKAEPIYDYYLRSVAARFKANTPEGKRRIGEELIPIWAKISEPITAEHYIQKLAALLVVPDDLLRREMKKQASQKAPNYEIILRQNESNQIINRTRRDLLEEYLLALLVKIPADTTYVPNFPETLFLSENYRSIYVLLVLYLDAISFKGKSFNISEFVKTVPEEQVSIIDRLYLIELDEKLVSSDAWLQEMTKVINELKKALVKASLEKLSAEIKNAQVFGKMELLSSLNKRFRDLSVKLKSL